MKITRFICFALLLTLLPCCKSKKQPAAGQGPQLHNAVALSRPLAQEEPQDQFDYTFETGGVKFRTFISPRYGANDIWLSYSKDGKEYRDVFTGCALQAHAFGGDFYSAAAKDGKIIISYERAVSMGGDAQQTRLVATLAEIERDSDSDGLPDIAEYRLMTSTTNPDTDGDGKKDGEDLNPLASGNIHLSEQQKIWAAGFKQHLPEMPELPTEGVMLAVFDEEAEFFEIPGRSDPVVSVTEEHRATFVKHFGYAVPTVFFAKVSYLSREEGKEKIEFELTTFFHSTFARGYMLTLKKKEGKWKLVDSRVEWVS